ncbi:unnamed protein product [Spirodela intermedia]|uniref:DWNN domain-containing protein n=1 Tax=Spirodela intermedia TaxID=51605 RepID=A0A7I8J487_SPIIN|nr:unnamed protein product [Spirodela intermedia]CAA6665037.1 unnamed protein product [Spirodela intermedia]
MAVYYKFKSAKDFDSIPIDGHFISVKHLGRGTDFDLMVSNAQTNEEYVDEAMLIPKNTSVLIRRVPGRPRKTIVAAPDDQIIPRQRCYILDSCLWLYPEEPEWDEFGNDLYDIPEALPVQSSNQVVNISPPNVVDEENKIKAFVDTTALDWQRQLQENVGSGRGFGRGMGGRMMGGRGMGRGGGAGGGMVRKTPPQGYVCHRCNSMLIATPDGSYALPSGAVAVMKPNEAAFEKEIEGLPSARSVTDFPPELRCPLCKDVMKDAVLTSKCCFSSFCDKCIRDYIISKSMCVCGATNILADDLVPNKTVRVTINHILESTTSSADNAGSLQQVQDMESARPAQMKAPSPTQSATSKEGSKALLGRSRPRIERLVSMRMRARAPPWRDSKKKKKKKPRLPGAGDMQWRPYPDVGGPENFGGMPMGPYNPVFPGGMPWGMDGYLGPLHGAAMPLMGYMPGPYDAPYGGMMPPQDPYAAAAAAAAAAQGFMMPVLLKCMDLSELSMTGANQSLPPPGMSREEMDARKAAEGCRRNSIPFHLIQIQFPLPFFFFLAPLPPPAGRDDLL